MAHALWSPSPATCSISSHNFVLHVAFETKAVLAHNYLGGDVLGRSNKTWQLRYEKRDNIHQSFLIIGCLLICWNRIQKFLLERLIFST